MKPQLAKGMRDLKPEDMIILKNVVSILEKNFAIFGYNPIQTPSIERYDTMASKYTGGAEILKETFKLTDQGKRKLALRYDLTVPVCRFMAMNPQLKMPFKRYQIGRVFRDGPIRPNRYREFTQCDVDVIGVKGVSADAECVEVALKCFEDFKIPVVLQVNNRKVLDELMEKFGIKKSARTGTILAIDKIEKKLRVEIEKEIKALGVKQESIDKLFDVFMLRNNRALEKVEEVLGSESEGVKEIKELLALCPYPSVVFNPALARGLSYYTGTVFEVFVADGSIRSSVAGGGRYDNMIAALMGSKQEYPAVGISFGLDVIVDALKRRQKSVVKSTVSLYVVPIGVEVKDVWSFVKELRGAGIATDLSFGRKGITKNIKYADSYGIPYVLLVGEDEIKSKKFSLKNLKTGKEKKLTLKQVIKEVKS
jgi:histidyl-tRNA synthetase